MTTIYTDRAGCTQCHDLIKAELIDYHVYKAHEQTWLDTLGGLYAAVKCSHCRQYTLNYDRCRGCNYIMCDSCTSDQDHVCCEYMYNG